MSLTKSTPRAAGCLLAAMVATVTMMQSGAVANGDCVPGTATPGYWMNHPETWSVESITIGGEPFTRDEAVFVMGLPTKNDKTLTMFAALVAAQLNVLAGNSDSCIADTIEQADQWMAAYPIGSEVRGSSEAWQSGEPLSEQLDAYNNGRLCAPSRDQVDCDDDDTWYPE